MTAAQRTVFVPRPRPPSDGPPAARPGIRRSAAGRVPAPAPALRRGTVLAAVDGGETTWPVLAIAQVIGGVLGVPMRAVHARPAGTAPPRRLSTVDVPLRTVEGDVNTALLAAGSEDDVVAVVVGARTRVHDDRALGGTAAWLATALDKPVVVVPPDADPCPQIRRVLVPLDGTAATSVASRPLGQPALDADLEVQALHVMTPETATVLFERGTRGGPTWTRDFLARYCDWGRDSVSLLTRIGRPEELVAKAVWECGSDLVVLGWSQRLTPGRAQVVRSVLREAPVPVALLPVPNLATPAASGHRTGSGHGIPDRR